MLNRVACRSLSSPSCREPNHGSSYRCQVNAAKPRASSPPVDVSPPKHFAWVLCEELDEIRELRKKRLSIPKMLSGVNAFEISDIQEERNREPGCPYRKCYPART